MKEILAIVFLLFLSNIIVTAQIGIQTQRAIGGSDDDNLYNMQLTKDGGYILAGQSWSGISSEKTETSRGESDFWIVKLNRRGGMQWQKTLGGISEEAPRSIRQTFDGGYIVGGYSTSGISGDKTTKNFGSYDYWLLKLSANGDVEWQKSYGGSDFDLLSSVDQTSDSGYILGGHTLSKISGNKIVNNFGGQDCWIIKVNAKGNIEWQKEFGDTETEYLNSIEQTSDGGFILGATSFSMVSGNKTENSFGFSDYWIIKLNSVGDILWQRTIGGSNSEFLGAGVHQTNNGSYIAGGSSNSDISGNKTDGLIGKRLKNDYWVVRLDEAGNIIWQNDIGGVQDDNMLSIEQTKDNGFILDGVSISDSSGDKTSNSWNHSYDLWIVRLNSLGNIEWDKTIGGTSYEYISAPIYETKDGGYVVATSSASDISGDKTEKKRGGYDYWLVKLSATTVSKALPNISNSNTSAIDNPGIKIYPNPVKDKLIIKCSSPCTISIYDVTGKLITTKKISGETTIDVHNIAQGIYYIAEKTSLLRYTLIKE